MWDAFKATLIAEQKSERDNGVAPVSVYANNAHGRAAAEALNNLAAATAADLQAAANLSCTRPIWRFSKMVRTGTF